MGMKLFLVAFIVNVGTRPVLSNNKVDTHPSGIRDNFRNLFHAIWENNAEKTETHRNFLGQEAVKEGQAFDAMKNEFRLSRRRNAHEKRNLYRTSYAAVFKREAAKGPRPANATGHPYARITDAAEGNDTKAVKWFIEEDGILPNQTNEHEMTAAHVASRIGNLDIVKYILEKDIDVLNMWRGEEVFVLAVKYGNLDIVKYLVEELELDIERRFTSRFYGCTAIHIAAWYEQQEVLEYFLEDRKGNVNVLNDVLQTPLFEAVERRYHPMIKYLVEERGADLKQVDYMRETILDKLVKKQDFVMLRYFIYERNMTVRVRWRNEQTHMAALNDCPDLMKFLIDELRADVNCADLWGKTPLHAAAKWNHYSMCEYLLKRGANPRLRDVDGLTAADDATYENVTTLLKEAIASAPRHRRSPLADSVSFKY